LYTVHNSPNDNVYETFLDSEKLKIIVKVAEIISPTSNNITVAGPAEYSATLQQNTDNKKGAFLVQIDIWQSEALSNKRLWMCRKTNFDFYKLAEINIGK